MGTFLKVVGVIFLSGNSGDNFSLVGMSKQKVSSIHFLLPGKSSTLPEEEFFFHLGFFSKLAGIGGILGDLGC